jgi:hypothetical protein
VVLPVTDELNQTADTAFDVTLKMLCSNPPNIGFGVGRGGVTIEQGQGFSLSAAATSDPDGDWIRSVAWDVNDDGTNDVVWTRTDTNADGRIDGAGDDAAHDFGHEPLLTGIRQPAGSGFRLPA